MPFSGLELRVRRWGRRFVSSDATAFANALARGSLWTLLGAIASQVCSLLTSIVAARLLGRTVFGELAIVQSTMNMLAGVGSAGIGVTSTRYLSQVKDTDATRAGRILGVSSVVSFSTAVVFSVALFLMAPVLATRSFNSPGLVGALRISCIAVFFVTMNAFQSGSLIGLHAFRTTAVVNGVQGGVSLLTTLLLIPGFGLRGAVEALVLTSGTVWFWSQKLLRSECSRYGIRITYTQIWQERKIFFDFALPAALSGITGQIAVWGSNALLARQLNGMAELGLFAVANTFRQMVLFTPGILTRVAMPLLATLTRKASSPSFRPSFNLNVRINAALGVTTAACLAVAAPFLLRIYGKGFSAALTTTFVLLGAAVLESTSWGFYQALIGHGRIWWQYAFATVWSAFLVGGALLLGPRFGALGLGLGYLAGWAFSLVAYATAATILNDRAEVQNDTSLPVASAEHAVPVAKVIWGRD